MKIRYGRIIKVGRRGCQVKWEGKDHKHEEEWLKGVDFEVVNDKGEPIDARTTVVSTDAPPDKPGKPATERDLTPGMTVTAVFRFGEGPAQKVRRFPARVDSVMRHGAVVILDGERMPQTKRYADIELIPEEMERIAAKRAADEAEKQAKRRVVTPGPKSWDRPEPTIVESTEPTVVEPIAKGPLASAVDALIDGVEDTVVNAPPPPVVPPVPTTPKARHHAPPPPVATPAPAPVAAPVEEVEEDNALSRLISHSASAAEQLMTKAAKIEIERATLLARASTLAEQISVLEEERQAALASAAAKDAELVRVTKAVDAIAALEALGIDP